MAYGARLLSGFGLNTHRGFKSRRLRRTARAPPDRVRRGSCVPLPQRAGGRVPHRGEKVRIDDFVFEILRGDARQIHVLLVRRVPNLTQQSHSGDDEGELRD